MTRTLVKSTANILFIGLLLSVCLMLWRRSNRSHHIRNVRHSPPVDTHHTEPPYFALNKTPEMIVFNRIPKTGSRTVSEVIRSVCQQNYISHTSSELFYPYRLLTDDKAVMMAEVTSRTTPHFYNRHVYFVDFKEFNLPDPFYINFVRHPFERLVSHHYFQLSEPAAVEGASGLKNLTFDECVEKKAMPCYNKENYFIYVPFFCGQPASCLEPSMESLQRAKHNIEKYYLTIGVFGEMESFFEVLEHLVPAYFDGALEIYKNFGHKEWDSTKTLRKGRASEQSRERMSEVMAYEYELYEFIAQRFKKQKKKILGPTQEKQLNITEK